MEEKTGEVMVGVMEDVVDGKGLLQQAV